MRGAFRTVLFAGLAALALGAGAPAAASASAQARVQVASSDADLLAEINFARTHPQDYARRLLLQPVSAWERALAEPADPGALAEAVEFLERQTPLPPLQPDDDLAAAALEHVAAQGPAGRIGHDGPAGEAFDARLARHGIAGRTEGENIAYGPARAADVVRELIIDSGVPDRGHRRNFFHPAFAAAGVTCGPHRDYGTMCVIDFASGPARSAPAAPALSAPIQVADAAPEAPAFEVAATEIAVSDVVLAEGAQADQAGSGSGGALSAGGWWWGRNLRTLLER